MFRPSSSVVYSETTPATADWWVDWNVVLELRKRKSQIDAVDLACWESITAWLSVWHRHKINIWHGTICRTLISALASSANPGHDCRHPCNGVICDWSSVICVYVEHPCDVEQTCYYGQLIQSWYIRWRHCYSVQLMLDGILQNWLCIISGVHNQDAGCGLLLKVNFGTEVVSVYC